MHVLTIIHLLLSTPLNVLRLLLSSALYLLPLTRPRPSWTLNQAVRVRIVRLVLHYLSTLRWGDALTLKPGREGPRFQVLPPAPKDTLVGPLAGNAHPVGVTWTPDRPASIRGEKVALQIHGGGFVIYSGRDHDAAYTAKTLRRCGADFVVSPQYRLSSSPGGHFPAALQDVLSAYIHLVQTLQIPPKQIILSGDSAGGNLALGLLRYISTNTGLNLPLPGAVLLWSPWVDVSAALEGEIAQSPQYHSDYLNGEFGKWGAQTVAKGVDVKGPYLSPLHHPFPLKVPVWIQGGDAEVLYDDIKLFTERAQAQGWDIKLHTSKDCPHDILLLGDKMGFEGEARAAAEDAFRIVDHM